MYQKKFKQLMAAVLCAALVMGQAPIAHAASVEEDELIIIEDSSVSYQSEDDDSFDYPSNAASEDLSDDSGSSNEASDEIELIDDQTQDSTEEFSNEDVSEEEVSEEDISLPDGVKGMPAGYQLTAEEKALKAELNASEENPDDLTDLVEGVDYISDQVICLAESEEHAKEIAAAYSGELTSFEYGVAVIDLSGSEVDVETAYKLSFDETLNLPVVEPNYIYHLIEPVDTDEDLEDVFSGDELMSGEEISTDEDIAEFEATGSWKDVYNQKVNNIYFNDPFLNPVNKYYQWHHDMINTYDAWKVTTGGSYKVTVAVIDSGVQTSHPELSGRVTPRSGDGADGDGHGTHVAGIIAASAGNGAGGSGIAPKANILSVRILGNDGRSTSNDALLKALRYVAGVNADGSDTKKRRADIANMSLGGPIYATLEQVACNLCTERGVTLVAAMGNELSNHKSYPAAYKNVIAVGAVSESGSRAYFSCYGSWQDISAPGTDITSSFPTNLSARRYTGGSGYEVMSGTSQATPIVAGACALYMSYVGHVEPAAMEKALKSTSTKGILNVGKLLSSAKPSEAQKSSLNADYTVKKLTLGEIAPITYSASATGTARVTSITNTNDKNVLSDTNLTYTWVSSDTKVVSFSGKDTATGKSSISFKVEGAGKATITCMVQTEKMKSPKSASVAVTVTGSKTVTSVTIKNGSAANEGYRLSEKKDKALSAATIYLGNSLSSINLKAVQQTKKGTAPSPLWVSSNEKVATVVNGGTTATVKAVSKGKTTISCIARDGSGKKASVTITVAQGVTDVRLKGQTYAYAGSKASYKASVYPKNASFKTVTYSLDKKYTGITINEKTGQVSIDKKASGTFKVTARSTDPGAKSATVTVTIGIRKKATKVTMDKPATTTIATAAKGSLKNSVTLSAKANNGADLYWTSSNENIAKLSANTGASVTLTAVSAGKATVTAMANDGSGKKASIAITVVNPVASLHLAVKGGNSDYSIATGCSTTLIPVLGSTYGTPSNKKVEWSLEIKGIDNSGNLKSLSAKAQDYCKTNNAFFTVNNKGKLTANSLQTYNYHINNIKSYGASYSEYAVTVTAKAADGSGSSDNKTFYVVPKNTSLRFHNGSYYYRNSFFGNYNEAALVFVNANYYELAVESSNPNVASAYITTVKINGVNKRGVYIQCLSRGTAKITVKTVDGSGVKGSFDFTVR